MEARYDGVDYSYKSGTQVLHDINLKINEPGLLCIIGPNGVGKSTMVKCMNKLLIPSKGSVTLDDRNVRSYSLKELSKTIGFVPATSSDNFSMTVIDTVLMGRHPHQKVGSEKNDMHIVYQVLDDLKITHLALRNYNELSAGQHQKVSIARGLAQEPDILILDEPTANLDVRHQVQVIELLLRLSHERGMTVVMISHDLNIAAKYADKIVVMSTPGVIYRVGTPNEVITEDTIRYVYGMECTILNVDDRPHVILGEPLSDEVIHEMHRDEMIEHRGLLNVIDSQHRCSCQGRRIVRVR